MKRERRSPVPAAAPSGVPAHVVGGFLFLLVFLMGLTEVSDGDAWWHLKTGQLIWRGGIPRVDPFSYALEGRPWVAFEWLAQALFYALYRLGGSALLVCAKALALAAAFWLLWRTGRERPVWSAVVVWLAALGCRFWLVERPFLFDYLLLAGLSAAFWGLRFDAPPRRLLWLLPAGTALWANLHGGAAVLAPGLTVLAVAAERAAGRRIPARFWAGTVGLCGLALLATPHGAALLAHLRDTLTFPAKDLLYEWHRPAEELLGVYGLFLAAGAAALPRLARTRPFAAAWLAAAAAASLGMRRNVPVYLILAAPALANAWSPSWRIGRARAALLGGLMAAGTWLHAAWTAPHLLERFGLGERNRYAGAAAFLDRAGVEGRMFNEYEAGGPLIWLSGPGRKVFIDGRSLEHGPERVRAALSWHRPVVWEALDSRWRFDYAVVRRHPAGGWTTRQLDGRPEWRLAYWDDDAMVYLRADGANAEAAARLGLELLMPGRGSHQYVEAYLGTPRSADRLLDELERSLREAPDCADGWGLKAYVLARLGRLDAAADAAGRAAALKPRAAQFRMTLGWVLAAAGKLPAAERAYREALALTPRRQRAALGADVLNNLGRVLERRGDREGALASYRKALRWNPGQGDAKRNVERLSARQH